MSQNAVLDRETVAHSGGNSSSIAPTPVARSQRDHLTLMDWDLTPRATAPITTAISFPPVVPARRLRFGWSEACVGLLFLASGAACVASLLNL